MLLHMDDVEKALIYLSVAAHQMPECVKYAHALSEAQSRRAKPAGRFANRLARVKAMFL